MSRGSWALIALMISSVLAQGALAQSVSEEVDQVTGRKIKYEQRQEIDFTELLQIEGELVGPDGKIVTENRRPVFNPLIELRHHFKDEMKASVDEVK